MPWAKIDDDAPSHPKFVRAGSIAAFGFWTAGNCYCNKRLTDGFIARESLGLISPVVKLAEAKRLAVALVDAGLWEEAKGGWHVHDFHQYNPSAEDVKADRKATTERIRRWRDKRRGNAPRNAVTPPPRNGSGNAVTSTPVTPLVTLPPARAVLPARPLPPNPPDASPLRHDWPPGVNRSPLVTSWLPGRWPYEAFNHDCPKQAWRGQCVRSDYADAHPQAYPTNGDGGPKQCEVHRVGQA